MKNLVSSMERSCTMCSGVVPAGICEAKAELTPWLDCTASTPAWKVWIPSSAIRCLG